MSSHEDDLLPSQTAGYKPGDKKTIEQYQNLDAGDESIKKWKESLGLDKAAAYSPQDDPRRVVVEYIALEVEGRDDVIVDLSTKEALEQAKKNPFTIKASTEFRMKVKFRVQHEVVSGLKYIQIVKRMGIRVDKTEEMIGSYGPSADAYEKKFQLEEAPNRLHSGHYSAVSRFVDDDNVVHMEWNWSFDVKKDWK
ncbi:Rho GDP-dissociation inhibitor 2 [Phycomyces nitens]|nr:Rho GDP-dissociation inhibitor 2 [Phycomyces nitens]